MQIARYSFCIRFCSAEQLHEFPHKCFFLDAAPLVGRIDHLCPRDRCNMPAGFGNRWGASQIGRTQEEKKLKVAGRQNLSIWEGHSSTLPDWGRNRQRARFGRATSEASRCSRHSARPAVMRAESPTGSVERILEIERVSRMRLAIAGADFSAPAVLPTQTLATLTPWPTGSRQLAISEFLGQGAEFLGETGSSNSRRDGGGKSGLDVRDLT